MTFIRNQQVTDYSIVAFDTETSGAYPLESEVIELGAVKYFNGEVVGRFQTLLSPSKLLTPDNIKIHGITNEMLVGAPKMSSEIIKFCDFVENSILVAHHAPFDLGFIAIEIEKSGLNWPNTFNLCSSLLSRALLHTSNHKLQTLIKELQLIGGEAHRAYDDAYASLQVLLKCFEKVGNDLSLNKIMEIQKKELIWSHYSLSESKLLRQLTEAILKHQTLQIRYEGGKTKNEFRPIRPIGLVRNPDGDYIHAECRIDFQRKRFYLSKIIEVQN